MKKDKIIECIVMIIPFVFMTMICFYDAFHSLEASPFFKAIWTLGFHFMIIFLSFIFGYSLSEKIYRKLFMGIIPIYFCLKAFYTLTSYCEWYIMKPEWWHWFWKIILLGTIFICVIFLIIKNNGKMVSK